MEGEMSENNWLVINSLAELEEYEKNDIKPKCETVLLNKKIKGGVLPKNAFSDWTSLKTIVIPENIELSEKCFSGCINLCNVVTYSGDIIAEDCFKDCTSLQSILVKTNKEILSKDATMFKNCSSIILLKSQNSGTINGLINSCPQDSTYKLLEKEPKIELINKIIGNNYDNTALVYAAQKGYPPAIKLLMETKEYSEEEKTALDFTIKNKKIDNIDYFQKYGTERRNKNSPLYTAIKYGNITIINELLEYFCENRIPIFLKDNDEYYRWNYVDSDKFETEGNLIEQTGSIAYTELTEEQDRNTDRIGVVRIPFLKEQFESLNLKYEGTNNIKEKAYYEEKKKDLNKLIVWPSEFKKEKNTYIYYVDKNGNVTESFARNLIYEDDHGKKTALMLATEFVIKFLVNSRMKYENLDYCYLTNTMEVFTTYFKLIKFLLKFQSGYKNENNETALISFIKAITINNILTPEGNNVYEYKNDKEINISINKLIYNYLSLMLSSLKEAQEIYKLAENEIEDLCKYNETINKQLSLFLINYKCPYCGNQFKNEILDLGVDEEIQEKYDKMHCKYIIDQIAFDVCLKHVIGLNKNLKIMKEKKEINKNIYIHAMLTRSLLSLLNVFEKNNIAPIDKLRQVYVKFRTKLKSKDPISYNIFPKFMGNAKNFTFLHLLGLIEITNSSQEKILVETCRYKLLNGLTTSDIFEEFEEINSIHLSIIFSNEPAFLAFYDNKTVQIKGDDRKLAYELQMVAKKPNYNSLMFACEQKKDTIFLKANKFYKCYQNVDTEEYKNGATALTISISNNNQKYMKELLTNEGSIIRTKTQTTVLMLAVQEGKKDLVDDLIKYNNGELVGKKDKKGNTSFCYAVFLNNTQMIEKLMKIPGFVGKEVAGLSNDKIDQLIDKVPENIKSTIENINMSYRLKNIDRTRTYTKLPLLDEYDIYNRYEKHCKYCRNIICSSEGSMQDYDQRMFACNVFSEEIKFDLKNKLDCLEYSIEYSIDFHKNEGGDINY